MFVRLNELLEAAFSQSLVQLVDAVVGALDDLLDQVVVLLHVVGDDLLLELVGAELVALVEDTAPRHGHRQHTGQQEQDALKRDEQG